MQTADADREVARIVESFNGKPFFTKGEINAHGWGRDRINNAIRDGSLKVTYFGPRLPRFLAHDYAAWIRDSAKDSTTIGEANRRLARELRAKPSAKRAPCKTIAT
jgi:hypothetical protein